MVEIKVMKTFNQYLNEGRISIDMKRMDKAEKKDFIELAQSLQVKRDYDLEYAGVSLGRFLVLKTYYLNLPKLEKLFKSKGFKFKTSKKVRGSWDMTMESLNEAKRPRRGEETIAITWDMGKPGPGELKSWEDEYNVYVEKLRRNDIWISGERKDLYKWLEELYGMEPRDIEKEYPELF